MAPSVAQALSADGRTASPTHAHTYRHPPTYIPTHTVADGAGRIVRNIGKRDGPDVDFENFTEHYQNDVKAKYHRDTEPMERALAWCAYRTLVDRCSHKPHSHISQGFLKRKVLLNDNSGGGVYVYLGPDGWSEPVLVPAPHF